MKIGYEISGGEAKTVASNSEGYLIFARICSGVRGRCSAAKAEVQTQNPAMRAAIRRFLMVRKQLGSLSGRAVTFGGCSILLQMACGPKNTMGQEVEVARVGDGCIVMANGGAEHAGFLCAIFIHPGNDIIIGFLRAVLPLDRLLPMGQRLRGVE